MPGIGGTGLGWAGRRGRTRIQQCSHLTTEETGREPVSIISNIFCSTIGEVGQLTGVELQNVRGGYIHAPKIERKERRRHIHSFALPSTRVVVARWIEGRGRPPDAALADGHSILPLRYRRRATNGEEDREGVTSGESLGRSLFLQKYGTNFFTPGSSPRFPPLLDRLRRPRWEKLEKVGVHGGERIKGSTL